MIITLMSLKKNAHPLIKKKKMASLFFKKINIPIYEMKIKKNQYKMLQKKCDKFIIHT